MAALWMMLHFSFLLLQAMLTVNLICLSKSL